MIRRDIHRAEGSLNGMLEALHAAGPFAVIGLVVMIHVLAFGGYGLYAAFTHETAGAYAWASLWVVVALLVRRVLSRVGLPDRVLRWATVAMLLVVAGRLEAATGSFGAVTRAMTGVDADVVVYRSTGVVLGPVAAALQDEDASAGICRLYKADGSLYNGQEWGVSRTQGCMRLLTPADGERSCRAFSATRAHFTYADLREFCGSWVKGSLLQPWDRPPAARSAFAR